MVTQAFPLSDAVLTAKPKSTKEISTPVLLINSPAPDKETNGMTPRPYCQQSAVVSMQASGITQAPTHTKAQYLGNLYERLSTNSNISSSYLPTSRGTVHTALARQVTLVGSRPSGTS